MKMSEISQQGRRVRNVPLAFLPLFLCTALAMTFGAAAIHAQSDQDQPQQRRPMPTSELSRQNDNRVAASAIDLKAVFLRDPGLMVEIKRWIAKDATDNGQMVTDNDLADDAVFERIENDVRFRSVCTKLVQKYGYLVPKLNPESDQAKEHELLVQERVKWTAQEDEEARARARQEAADQMKGFEKQQSCQRNPGEAGCNNPAAQPAASPGNQPSGTPSQGPQGAPSQPNRQNPPSQTTATQQTQLETTGYENDASDVPLGSADQTFGGAGSAPQGGQRVGGSGGLSAGGGAAMESPGGTPSGVYSSEWATSDIGQWNNPQNPQGNQYIPVSNSLPNTATNNAPANPNQPEMVRQRSPYRDIPSLYDMYMQAIPHETEPRRFGAQVFENGDRNLGLIPMDMPVGPDYVVGPGDGLTIDLWGGVSRRLTRVVDREGRVSIPEAGPILVNGKSLSDVQQQIEHVLRTQFHDESADVSISRLRTIRVYEVGEVVDPGAHDISSLSTPLNALFAASGPTPQGSMRVIKHYRGDQLVQTVDLYSLLLHGVRTDMQRLQNGDTIMVPPVGPQVTVEGMVRRPAIYELKDEKTLADAIELAGGMLPTAALRHIEVQRLVAHEKRTMLTLDISDTSDKSDVTKKLEAFNVQDGDKVRIFPIAAYNEDAIYLEGHVIRPGRYSYHPNMKVTDIIGSYKDLLPEPATKYAEIIRLNAPDFRPSVESFNLSEALANPASAPELKPLDTVRVFGRFDFENPPTVSVWGDVRRPGTYQTSGQIRLADAVHLAGGTAPDAQLEDAQVFSYQPDGTLKISSVNLKGAIAGDASANVLLQPRDRVLVHKNSNAEEPAAVYVGGDVNRPGRYPYTSNMTVADLVRVGGGLKPSADTNSADLTLYAWTNQSQMSGQHLNVALSKALAGDPDANVPLHNGDVLTVRQVPGWNDLGAFITVRGEVKHPGTYGIQPGEKLSSVLERAGGFQPDAYPYGSVLQRTSVREVQAKDQNAMIMRLKAQRENIELLPVTTQDQIIARETALQQWQSTLQNLASNPPVGRVAIRISNDIPRWSSTTSNIEVRNADVITIPKKPNVVMVAGQVYNPTAVAYRPGKSAGWYLSQSGGPTQLANKKAIFVIRADGSVMGAKSSLWSGASLSASLRPGDTVVVPEKAVGGGLQWQNIYLATQVAAAVATTAILAVHY
jgi:protein involved in polysaccharide export with SLBB domain